MPAPYFLLASSQFNDLTHITWQVIIKSNRKFDCTTRVLTTMANNTPTQLVDMARMDGESSLALRLA